MQRTRDKGHNEKEPKEKIKTTKIIRQGKKETENEQK